MNTTNAMRVRRSGDIGMRDAPNGAIGRRHR
jgi:hypothetical protein